MSEQRTYEWFANRWGKITMSSRVSTLMTGHVHQLNNLVKTLRWEQLEASEEQCRQAYEAETRVGDTNRFMSWGKQHEEEGLTHYELTRNIEVIRCEFIVHPKWPRLVGDSADFIECDDGTLTGTPKFIGELKCPATENYHKKYIRYGHPAWPGNYHQVQGHIETHDIDQAKFVSYDPRHPIEEQQIYVEIVDRDQKWQKLFHEKMEVLDDHFRNGTLYEHAINQFTDGIPSMF